MTIVTVAGSQQSDIEDAITAAGIYGTVHFPNGEYLVSGLAATVANQTWELERNAVIKRSSGTSILNIQAVGLRIRGGVFDGNRSGVITTDNGIISAGFGLDAEDIVLQNVGGWGMVFTGTGIQLILRKSTIKNTGFACLLWISSGWNEPGPIIEHCLLDRSTGFISQGGVHIRSNGIGTAWVKAPKILFTDVLLPEVPNLASTRNNGPHMNSVGLEIWNSVDPLVEGCSITYSKIGISYGNTRNGKMIGNSVNYPYFYGLEVAGLGSSGGLFNVLTGNVVLGARGQPTGTAAPSRGVSITAATHDTKVVGNSIYWCSVPVGVNTGCLRTIIANN